MTSLQRLQAYSSDINRALEMLKVRYSMLIHGNDEPATVQLKVSPKRHTLFGRRNDRRRNFEPESPGATTYNADLHNDRRDAFEVDREETNLGKVLAGVKTRQNYCDPTLLPNGTHLLGCDGTMDLGKDNVIPPPLFSPKRGPTLVYSSATELLSIITAQELRRKQATMEGASPFRIASDWHSFTRLR